MKKLLYLSLALFLFACSEAPVVNKAVISGKIINPVNDFVFVRSMDQSDSTMLDSTGIFRLEMDIDKPGYYIFSDGNEITHIYISPGDNIYMTLNTEAFDETIEYSGHGSVPNKFLAGKYLVNEKMTKDPKESYMLNEEEFRHFVDSNHTVLLHCLDTFFAGQSVQYDEFIDFEKSKMLYDKATLLLVYPSYYMYFSGNKDYQPGEDYYAFLDEVDINNSRFLELQEFKSFVGRYISHKAGEKVKQLPQLKKYDHPYYMAVFAVINDEVMDTDVKNYLLEEFMMRVVNYEGLDKSDTLLAMFYDNCTNTALIQKVDEGIIAWERITKGQTAPGFKYPDINDKMIALEDFKGKYVYIDVWSTRCGPCIAEIPYIKELQQEFKDKNIVFVSVSLDNSRSAWEKMVKDRELKGVQLFAMHDWESTINKDYNIKGIPRFIMIDKEGKIVDATAPRPSGKIRDVILSLEGI